MHVHCILLHQLAEMSRQSSIPLRISTRYGMELPAATDGPFHSQASSMSNLSLLFSDSVSTRYVAVPTSPSSRERHHIRTSMLPMQYSLVLRTAAQRPCWMSLTGRLACRYRKPAIGLRTLQYCGSHSLCNRRTISLGDRQKQMPRML